MCLILASREHPASFMWNTFVDALILGESLFPCWLDLVFRLLQHDVVTYELPI